MNLRDEAVRRGLEVRTGRDGLTEARVACSGCLDYYWTSVWVVKCDKTPRMCLKCRTGSLGASKARSGSTPASERQYDGGRGWAGEW